jgi:hypothetical protein
MNAQIYNKIITTIWHLLKSIDNNIFRKLILSNFD